MTTEALLQELEGLTHEGRMRRMVEVGRAAARDPEARTGLVEMEAGGFYERWLALQACHGSRDGAHAVRALADPSRRIRGLALRLIPLVADDDQALAAVEAVPYAARRVLLRELAKRRRRAPIDRFLDQLAARGDERLGSALRFGSPEVAARHLEPVAERADPSDWRGLAKRHPALAARALQARAQAVRQLDARLLWQANAALPILSDAVPDAALDLARALLLHASLSQLEIHQLSRHRPAEVAELVLGSEDWAGVNFDAVLPRLDLDRLLALIERRGRNLHDSRRWLRRLTPDRRASVFLTCALGWRDADGCIDSRLVELLRRDHREQEGRRHLALPALQTRPLQRLPYAALLPWDEARVELNPFLGSPEADQRAAALAALIRGTRFHRDRLPDLLSLVISRGNEQDPVRGAMLKGLAELPPGIWRAEHLDALGQTVGQALDAPDISAATANAAEQLVVLLLGFHPAWSSAWLATQVQRRGQISQHGLERRLSDQDMRRIAPDLLPVLSSWATREREGQLLAAAASFGRRLRVFSGLVELLEQVLRETRSHWTAERALNLIAKHRSDRLAVLVPALLSEDPSWITRSAVYTYLHRRRQDLLTPFLGQKAYRGRFSTGKTRFVLPLFSGFQCWTAAQQEQFARTLTKLTEDPERDDRAVLTAIRQLVALPAVPPARLIELASLRCPKPAWRDAALMALGRLDAGEGVPPLVEALGDRRARVAIYALRPPLLQMPASQLLALLRGVSLEKVTVAKEVIRLLGELPNEDAYQELLAIERRDLHRDVRIALLRALWSHLERAESWEILARAARSPDPAIAAPVGRIPVDRLSLPLQKRLVELLATLLSHPDPTVRLGVLRRCASLPVSDPEQRLLAGLLAALGSPYPDECAAAAAAVFATYAGQDAVRVREAVERVLPHRYAIQTVVHTLRGVLNQRRDQMQPAARAALEALASDPLLTRLQVELLVDALPGEEIAVQLERLAAADRLSAEVLMTAAHAIESARSRRETTFLERLEAALGQHPDERLRRLALAALIGVARGPRGWTEERVARLHAYRSDHSPLVAAAAQFTFPPGEGAPP